MREVCTSTIIFLEEEKRVGCQHPPPCWSHLSCLFVCLFVFVFLFVYLFVCLSCDEAKDFSGGREQRIQIHVTSLLHNTKFIVLY